ncbi:MAG: sporulation integral membrane protein YtvI [Clostridia bacterium]|nr:sporulation integral membrane protein YtvI [Clostridia bacterium]
MTVEKKRAFIINFIYVLVIACLVYFAVKYAIKWIMPFVIAFLIAALLHPVIKFFTRKLKLKTQKPTAIVVTALFYCTFGVLISLILINTVTAVLGFIQKVPEYYQNDIAPSLNALFDNITQKLASLNVEIDLSLNTITSRLYSSLVNISSLVTSAFSVLSGIPGFLFSLLIMLISTFFIAIDYDMITKWTMAQLPKRASLAVVKVKEYVVKILFKYIRSYFLILCITFAELLLGFFIMHFITGLSNIFLLSLLIAVFDILPIVGTGTVMIPWGIIAILTGDFKTGICCLVIYGIITLVRQFIEPKIVGTQVGLHPIATLVSMIVGTKLFGAIGLFGFPITLALLKDLNDHGHIHIFKPIPEEPKDEENEPEKEESEEPGETENTEEPKNE